MSPKRSAGWRILPNPAWAARARSDSEVAGGSRGWPGLLASIVKETGRAFKSVAGNLSMRDVAVVALIVLTTAPELLVALGVGAGVIRVMISLAGVLVELFPDKKSAGGIGAEGRPPGLPEPEGELG